VAIGTLDIPLDSVLDLPIILSNGGEKTKPRKSYLPGGEENQK
jgi:hypothetical protein